ncbi:hypothetical protein M408DRAFT_180306 [Serendipita vermifera MAFF 305830]|uniref:Man(5)GlcNAc(2)-PP-dolichol translocation protein RFT1 n=1 Tax=Serendipita vermifera MAFF 305830 TaxID=933852 RepID=A0A0C2WK66_SERVB|nr:hypothetical protein M408DRAFT_180306 [Serendipita vermifera MAFF 305830]
MSSKESESTIKKSTGASKFLAGASSLVLLQVLTRLVTFFLNQILVRLSTPQVFGTAAIQFELLLSTILFLSREGVRLALLRSSTDEKKEGDTHDQGTDVVAGASTSKPQPPTSTRKRKGNQTSTEKQSTSQSERTTRESALLTSNIATLPVMLGVPLSLGLSLFYMYTASAETSSQPHFHTSIIIYTLSALVQLAAEPMYIFAQQELNFAVRLRSEASGVISRAAVTVCVLVLAKRLGKVGEKAVGDGDEWGLLAFALGQLAYGIFVLGTYIWTYWSRSSEWRWLPKKVTTLEKGHLKQRVFDPTLLTLTISMTVQSLVKHLLTEGDKVAVSRTSKLADQGGYAVASNYGSLVARIIFQPVEEISRVYFSKTLSVCTTEEPKSSSNATSKEDKRVQPEKPLTSTQQNALRQASVTLNTLLLLQAHLLLILMTFLPPYLPTLLSHFLPKKYLVTSAPSILQAYAYYLPMMALNGLVEAFAFSVMSPADVKVQTRWLFATSIFFGVSVWILADRLGLGEVGLVYANIASLGLRAAWAMLFSNKWFKRMWSRGVEADEPNTTQPKSSISTSTPGLSFRETIPPLSVLIASAVSSQVVRYSQVWFNVGSQNLLQQSQDRNLLISQAKHVIIGGFFALLCLGECYRSQRSHIQTLISLVRSRSS